MIAWETLRARRLHAVVYSARIFNPAARFLRLTQFHRPQMLARGEGLNDGSCLSIADPLARSERIARLGEEGEGLVGSNGHALGTTRRFYVDSNHFAIAVRASTPFSHVY